MKRFPVETDLAVTGFSCEVSDPEDVIGERPALESMIEFPVRRHELATHCDGERQRDAVVYRSSGLHGNIRRGLEKRCDGVELEVA